MDSYLTGFLVGLLCVFAVGTGSAPCAQKTRHGAGKI